MPQDSTFHISIGLFQKYSSNTLDRLSFGSVIKGSLKTHDYGSFGPLTNIFLIGQQLFLKIIGPKSLRKYYLIIHNY